MKIRRDPLRTVIWNWSSWDMKDPAGKDGLVQAISICRECLLL